jgi:hypothetical protein
VANYSTALIEPARNGVSQSLSDFALKAGPRRCTPIAGEPVATRLFWLLRNRDFHGILADGSTSPRLAVSFWGVDRRRVGTGVHESVDQPGASLAPL